MMAAERSEVAHNYTSSTKMPLFRAAFNQRSSRSAMPQQRVPQRVFHPREYGNPNSVPMELGFAQNTPVTSSSQPTNRETRVCHFCGKRGHLKSNCF